MIELIFLDHRCKLIDDVRLRDYVRRSRYWFQNFWEESSSPDINEGRQILCQVLRPEEGYSEEFRAWLVEVKIIPPTLVADL